jgi:hypothetical protein
MNLSSSSSIIFLKNIVYFVIRVQLTRQIVSRNGSDLLLGVLLEGIWIRNVPMRILINTSYCKLSTARPSWSSGSLSWNLCTQVLYGVGAPQQKNYKSLGRPSYVRLFP